MVGAVIVTALSSAAFAATAAGIVIAAGINLAVGFAAAYFLAKAVAPPGGLGASDYKQQIQSDKEAQRVLYGTRQVAMVLNFAEEQDGTQGINDKNGQSYEKLYLSGMFCNHPVHNWYDVMLDDKSISEYNNRAEVQWVNGTGQIPDILVYNEPVYDEEGKLVSGASGPTQYQSDMTGSTGFWAALKLTHDREVFSGIPSLRVTVEGKKVLDVRTGEMVFSDNAALVIYDFYVNYMRVNPSRMITGDVTGSFSRAANVCDGAGYKINGMFMLNQKPSDILNEMLKSCGGTLVRTAGSIGLLPAAWYGPATFTIEESDIVGSISMAPQEAMGDAVNVMKGSYVEPQDDWNEQDFEEIRDEALIARDGYEIADDISYSFVTNAEQARVLAHMELGRRTIGGATEITMNPKGGYCRVGRVVRLELPQLGLSGDYRVINQKENDDLTFTIGLIRDAEEIYDGTVGKPYAPPPLLDTGGAVVPAPIGLQYTVDYNEQVGNTIQGKLTWSRGSASAEKHLVEVQDVDSEEIVQAGETNSYVFNVTALPAGNYKGLVRAVDTRGRVSAPADVTWSIGQPEAPSAELTEINNSNWSIELIPNIAGGTPQGTLFEFYYLSDTDSYLTGQPSYDANSVNLAKLISTSSSLNHSGLTPDRWQHYYVRSINPYGVSDFVYFRTGTTNEESLVTTVVEKLKAVEIESENWLPNADGQSNQGYKLFSNATERYVMQDGTELTNDDASIDGLFVATNAEIRGHITAQTLTFVTEDSIPSEIDNSNNTAESVGADPAGSSATAEQNANAYTDSVASGLSSDILVAQNTADQAAVDAANAQATADGSVDTYYQATEPTTGKEGDIWVDTDDGNKQYMYASGSWVSIQDTGIVDAQSSAATAQDSADQAAVDAAVAQSTADGKVRTFYQPNQPTSGMGVGDIWVDTDDGNNQYMYTDTGWVDIQDQAIYTEAATAEQNAIAQAEQDRQDWSNANVYPDQDSLQIQGNYVSGVSGWAIDSDGNAEFNNGVFRGTVYATDGDFEGTVYADKIVGDVVAARRYSASEKTRTSSGTTTFDSVTVRNSRPYDRTLVLSVMVKASTTATSTGGTVTSQTNGYFRATGSFGTFTSAPNSCVARVYHPTTGGGSSSESNQNPYVQLTVIIPVPANETGTVTLSLYQTGDGSTSLRGVQSNYHVAQLFKNGDDLG